MRYSEHANRGPGAPEGVPRPAMSGGTVAGRGEPANRCWGAKGYTDRVNDMPPVTGGKSTNCGSGAWPRSRPVGALQQLRTDQGRGFTMPGARASISACSHCLRVCLLPLS